MTYRHTALTCQHVPNHGSYTVARNLNPPIPKPFACTKCVFSTNRLGEGMVHSEGLGLWPLELFRCWECWSLLIHHHSGTRTTTMSSRNTTSNVWMHGALVLNPGIWPAHGNGRGPQIAAPCLTLWLIDYPKYLSAFIWLQLISPSIPATPTVPHPKLPLLSFLAKTEKTFSNSSPSQVAIYPKLGKTNSASQRSVSHPPVLEEVEGYKNNFFFS
jgi:hypothetical protein